MSYRLLRNVISARQSSCNDAVLSNKRHQTRSMRVAVDAFENRGAVRTCVCVTLAGLVGVQCCVNLYCGVEPRFWVRTGAGDLA